jgi:hypothetical protein
VRHLPVPPFPSTDVSGMTSAQEFCSLLISKRTSVARNLRSHPRQHSYIKQGQDPTTPTQYSSSINTDENRSTAADVTIVTTSLTSSPATVRTGITGLLSDWLGRPDPPFPPSTSSPVLADGGPLASFLTTDTVGKSPCKAEKLSPRLGNGQTAVRLLPRRSRCVRTWMTSTLPNTQIPLSTNVHP